MSTSTSEVRKTATKILEVQSERNGERERREFTIVNDLKFALDQLLPRFQVKTPSAVPKKGKRLKTPSWLLKRQQHQFEGNEGLTKKSFNANGSEASYFGLNFANDNESKDNESKDNESKEEEGGIKVPLH